MTEERWFSSRHPHPMLDFIQHRISERKLRLYALACCREQIDPYEDADEAALFRCAERLADGLLSEDERKKAEDRHGEIRPLRVETASHAARVF
jgi:hypothetical protein